MRGPRSVNAPDLYDKDGQLVPERRRSAGRRAVDEDSIDPAVLLGWVTWVGRLWVRRKRLWALVSALLLVVGYLSGWVTKARAMAALERRVEKVENATDSLRNGVRGLRAAARFQNYVLCISVPTTAPAAARQMCQDVINKGIDRETMP
jgi:hypothetical protein